MHSYLAIQNTYDVFEIALFINNEFMDKKREDKHNTSKLFIPLLDELLKKNNAKIEDFDFCAINCGPGPFSTLRSIIASVNGLHFATNIPLIGIDGLEATFLEFYDNSYENTVVLLNAFNNEVYYLIAHRDQILTKGYQKINALKDTLQQVQGEREKQIHFLGNGASLHQPLIKEIFGNNAVIKEPNPSMCSVKMIGKIGLEKWLLKQTSSGLPEEALPCPPKLLAKDEAKSGYVMPLHLKKHAVEL